MGIDVNAQALSAIATATQVTANNVANVNTQGFKASRTTLESGAGPEGRGVQVQEIRKSTTPGPRLPASGSAPGSASVAGSGSVEGSNTDLGTEMVDLIRYERSFQANAQAIRIQDETLGSLLDELS